MKKIRINVLMPVALVEEINESVGPRKRSSFFVEAAKEKLERIKLAESMTMLLHFL
jgi:metal-responsive CopG/Arc/MetJ family transcriptional regulator